MPQTRISCIQKRKQMVKSTKEIPQNEISMYEQKKIGKTVDINKTKVYTISVVLCRTIVSIFTLFRRVSA